MPPKKPFEFSREFKMSRNKVSKQNCDIKMLHKKGFKNSFLYMYVCNLFKIGKFTKNSRIHLQNIQSLIKTDAADSE